MAEVGRCLERAPESVGADLSRFKNAKHFASWLGLCPGTKISGGKVLSGKSKRTANRAAQALRLAAVSLRTSQSVGAYYRRLCARMDKPRAVTACAHIDTAIQKDTLNFYYKILSNGML